MFFFSSSSSFHVYMVCALYFHWWTSNEENEKQKSKRKRRKKQQNDACFSTMIKYSLNALKITRMHVLCVFYIQSAISNTIGVNHFISINVLERKSLSHTYTLSLSLVLWRFIWKFPFKFRFEESTHQIATSTPNYSNHKVQANFQDELVYLSR